VGDRRKKEKVDGEVENGKRAPSRSRGKGGRKTFLNSNWERETRPIPSFR